MQMKRNVQLALASLVAVSGLAVAPAFAEQGERRANAQASTSTTEETPTGRVDELRERARTKLTEDRQAQRTERKAELKQKVCETRQENINKRVTNFGTAAQRHLDRLDGTYDKLQSYQEEKKLDADQYAALTTVADEKQVVATEAVVALKAVAVDIDCTAGDPAESVATIKEAVKNTRSALKEYRAAVKDVLVELMTSKDKISTGETN